MYKRKTHDEYIVYGNYGYGWDEIDTYLSRKKCVEAVKTYRANPPAGGAMFTWKTRRVRND